MNYSFVTFKGVEPNLSPDMSDLIDDLEREHEQLLDIFNQVTDTGIGTDEGKRKLNEARDLLIEHIQKEDDELYPTLEQRAENDPDVGQTLNRFKDGMEDISDDAMNFFDTYTGDETGMQFAKDAGNLLAQLKMRMRREENRLFPLYDS